MPVLYYVPIAHSEETRILYYVPMIHTDEDLDDLGSTIKMLREKAYGKNASDHDERAIEDLWKEIRLWVHQTVGDARGLIIYQDGMPVGPREKVHQLFNLVLAAHPRSPLFLLTQELIDMGAVLEGTEDINLVTKRIAVYREIYQAAEKCQTLGDIQNFIVEKVEEQDGIILQADRFIARHIDQTLPEVGRGILFMGHRHKVIEEIIETQEAGFLSSPIKIYALKLTINKRAYDVLPS